MKLSDLLDLSKLEAHVAAGEIKRRNHSTESLTIYNYGALSVREDLDARDEDMPRSHRRPARQHRRSTIRQVLQPRRAP